jgi:hypothetical protein
MGLLPMRALRAVSYGVVLIAPGLIAACANPTTSVVVNGGKYYAVSAKKAAFYRYGPQQGNGPDRKLPHDTLVTLIQPTFERRARLCRQRRHSSRLGGTGCRRYYQAVRHRN